jgi:hypothetical protein
MFKQLVLAAALSAVVIVIGLSAESRAFSVEGRLSFAERWAAVDDAIESGKFR